MNENYLYWDIDTTNWDAVYLRYKPLFSKLNINNTNDEQTSLGYFKEMTYGLTDGHFQLFFSRGILQNTSFYPAFQRKQGRPDFHLPFNYSAIDTQYFDKGYLTAYDSLTHPDQAPLKVTFATIHQDILFFSCSGFYLSDAYQSSNGNGVTPVLDSFFSELAGKGQNIKGLILDVRNNFGGNLSDLNFLVGRLIDKPLNFGYSRYKSGTGRLDLTPWIGADVSPQKQGIDVACPIIVLADAFTVSMGEMTTMAIAALPNGIVVGETSWGATGPLASNDLFNKGELTIPGFMTVYMSSAAFKYIDNKTYEGMGFPPDFPVPFDIQAVSSGKDLPMEKAIQLIH